MSGKRRGRVSFTDSSFADSTSLAALPEVERAPTHAHLAHLGHNPHNPRDDYAGDALDELAASLREIGQLQPISVVARDVFLAHHPEDIATLGSARWVVIMGNRRLAAARIAGLDELAVSVQDRLGGADPRLTDATLIENIHREALPPLLEARELQGLVERFGSQAAVAQRVAKTQGWVSQRLALLKLTPALQDRLRSGELTVREARKVAGEPAERQEQALAELRGPLAPPPAAPEPVEPPRARKSRRREEQPSPAGPGRRRRAQRSLAAWEVPGTPDAGRRDNWSYRGTSGVTNPDSSESSQTRECYW